MAQSHTRDVNMQDSVSEDDVVSRQGLSPSHKDETEEKLPAMLKVLEKYLQSLNGTVPIVKGLEKHDERLRELIPNVQDCHTKLVEVLDRMQSPIETSQPQRSLPPTSQNYSLLDVENHYKNRISYLEAELQKKSAENKKLHGFLQANQNIASLPDTQVEKGFSRLFNTILQFCYSLPSTQNKPSADDIYIWRSEVAKVLAKYVFLHNMYNAPESLDGMFADALDEFDKRKLPLENIRIWEAQVAKATGQLNLLDRSECVQRATNQLQKQLQKYVRLGVANTRAMEDLCDGAFELSSSLSNSGVAFEWQQSLSREYDHEFHNRLPGFEEPDGKGGFYPSRILFGPVVKFTDRGLVVVRKGELLTYT